jgi:hypothetical protein
MLDLGSLSGASLDGDRSFALGVNASDEVVGYSYLHILSGVRFQSHPIWTPTGGLHLPQWIDGQLE